MHHGMLNSMFMYHVSWAVRNFCKCMIHGAWRQISSTFSQFEFREETHRKIIVFEKPDDRTTGKIRGTCAWLSLCSLVCATIADGDA